MGIGEKLSHLVGTWKGTNRLFVPWMPEKIKESESTATVRSKMNGQFLSIDYSWSFDDPVFRILLLRGIAWTAKEPVDRFNEAVYPGAGVVE